MVEEVALESDVGEVAVLLLGLGEVGLVEDGGAVGLVLVEGDVAEGVVLERGEFGVVLGEVLEEGLALTVGVAHIL